MKPKFTSRLLDAIGFTIGLASALVLYTMIQPIVMSWTATAVYAEQPTLSDSHIQLIPAPGKRAQQFPEFAGIDLTQEQKEQIKAIRQEMQPKFEEIIPRPQLTPEQQEHINSGKPVRISLPTPTPEQQAKLKEVMEEYRQKVEAVLTPEQQEQFRQNQDRDMILFQQTRDI